jgi:predicted  nucleic acid-binding Zn-ribbon protein
MAENENIQSGLKFLDLSGLQKVWGKIKEGFTTKTEFQGAIESVEGDISSVNSKLTDLENSIDNIAVSSVDNKTIVAPDGKISAAIGIRLNEDKQEVELYATGPDAKKDATGQEVEGQEVLGSFSYAKFIQDGMLQNVELVVVAPSEGGDGETSTQAPGTYLKFSFNTDSGLSVIYVSVDDLVNVYEGSDYINVSGEVISLKKDALTEDLKSVFMTIEDFNTFKASYDEHVESVNTSLTANSEAIAALQESLGIIQPAVEQNTSDIETINGTLTTINGTLTANGEAIAALQELLGTIQPAVEQNTSDIESINSSLGELTPAVAQNTSNLSILSGRVDGISETVTANSNSISELLASLNLKANQESVDSLTERVATNESDIAELNKRVAELGQVVGPDGELISIHVSQITGLDALSEEDIESACS